MEREEKEAGPALVAPQPSREKGYKVVPMQENGTKAVASMLLAPPHHTSHNDSGYNSVFTSPEASLHGATPALGVSYPSLTPEVVGRVNTRLTSTPHSSGSQDGFRLPLPKIEAISSVVVERRSRHNSTSDSPITTIISDSPITTTTLTTATSLEMEELEMTCEEPSNQIIPHGAKVRSGEPSQQTPCRGTVNQGQQKEKLRSKEPPRPVPSRNKVSSNRKPPPPTRAINRLRKPQSAFVRLLKEADYLLRRILWYLSEEDLWHVSQVNRQLRKLVLRDKVLGDRRMRYLMARKSDHDRAGKENYKLKRLNAEVSSSSHRTLSPRKELSAIQNLCGSSSPEKAPPPRPLAERFMEEGKKLRKGEELQKCVKCKSPAVVHRSQQRAVCSHKACGYDYCISCHLPGHRRPQDCLSLRPRTRQATAGIFSDRCKRNLRRL